MSFVHSKHLRNIVHPSNLLLLLLLNSLIGLWLGSIGWARCGLTLAIACLLLVTLLPLDRWLLAPLEDRFPELAEPPERVAGVIMLAGAVDLSVMVGRTNLAMNHAGERLTALIELGRRYPDAKLVYSGGAGSLVAPDVDIPREVRAFYQRLGFDAGRIQFESESRNTFENATFSKAMVQPAPGERWILVTSAGHMPRSVGIFRKAGWEVIASPVDFQHGGIPWQTGMLDGLAQPSMSGRLQGFDDAVREWTGLVAYWLLGRTSALLPAP
jgi:uncharacterized SAM-binding protein YcdF (DUF218 family)